LNTSTFLVNQNCKKLILNFYNSFGHIPKANWRRIFPVNCKFIRHFTPTYLTKSKKSNLSAKKR